MDKKNNLKVAFKELMEGNISGNGESIDIKDEKKTETVKIELHKESSLSPSSDKLKDAFSILSSDCIIEGNIRTSSKMYIKGNVIGNISSEDDIFISGSIEGDVVGNNINLEGGYVIGNVESKGSVSIDENSVVIGNLTANDLEFKGKLKGDIKVLNSARFLSTSIASSDVEVGSISMELGATIKGKIAVSEEKLSDTVFDKIHKKNNSGVSSRNKSLKNNGE